MNEQTTYNCTDEWVNERGKDKWVVWWIGMVMDEWICKLMDGWVN